MTMKQKKLMMNNNEELAKDFTRVLDIYSSILEMTVSIKKEIKNENLEKVQHLLCLRDKSIDKANGIIKNMDLFDKEDEEKVNSIKEEIKAVELEVIAILEERKTDIKKVLLGIGVNKKNITAYKLNDVSTPRLFDETE